MIYQYLYEYRGNLYMNKIKKSIEIKSKHIF